jgi:type IV pilus assembly protein PilA
MLTTLRRRLRSEKGFTLIELLVVMIILAILTAIAIPSYLSFRDRANRSAAGADLRAAIPSVEAFFSDHGTYAGMTVGYLQTAYDQSIDPSIITLGAGTQTATSYCVQAKAPSDQTKTAAKAGPSAPIVIGGTCP